MLPSLKELALGSVLIQFGSVHFLARKRDIYVHARTNFYYQLKYVNKRLILGKVNECLNCKETIKLSIK